MEKHQFGLGRMMAAIGLIAAIICGLVGMYHSSGIAWLHFSLVVTGIGGLIGLRRRGHLGHWLAGSFIVSWPLTVVYALVWSTIAGMRD